MNKKIISISIMLIIAFLLQFIPAVYADEINENSEQIVEKAEENIQDETQAEDTAEKEEKEKDITEKTSTDNQKADESKNKNDNQNDNESTNTDNQVEEHKVAVITTKVDENGNALKGALLQIIDSNGNVVDEWTSNTEEHTSLLPEGTYTLHEKEAPEGYKLAADKTFTVKVEIADIDAGVDFSETPCQHYGGTPLYYVEIEGEKYEVYCINQDWETPDENSIYDGAVLNPSDMHDYTQQTVYVDAHQNKDKRDISDPALSSQELYDKILDIIYHRQKASEIFTDLTEAEIRYVTELALKNYTNAGLTRVQGIRTSQAPENYDRYDYYISGTLTWYLYPWYRSFIYDPDAPLGKDIFKTVIGEGDAFGTLARHWSDPAIKNGIITGHNAKNSEEVRQKVARFYELYQYLISNEEHHPSDMHLYIFATNNKATDLSGYNFDEGAYQNLLGIRWYNPYDENHKVYLTMVNEKAPEKKTTKKKKTSKKKQSHKQYENPQTGDSIMKYMAILFVSANGLTGSLLYTRKKED